VKNLQGRGARGARIAVRRPAGRGERMPRCGYGSILALALLVLPASADPLTRLLPAGKEACFQRIYDAAYLDEHSGQSTSSVLLSLRREGTNAVAELRLMLQRKDSPQPYYVVGNCEWWANHVNLGTDRRPLTEAFTKEEGVGCRAEQSLGSTPEEGGDFIIDLAGDGRWLTLYFTRGINAWEGQDQQAPASLVQLDPEDRIFRLDRVDSSACAEIEKAIAVD